MQKTNPLSPAVLWDYEPDTLSSSPAKTNPTIDVILQIPVMDIVYNTGYSIYSGYYKFSRFIYSKVVSQVVDIEMGNQPDQELLNREIMRQWNGLSSLQKLQWNINMSRCNTNTFTSWV